MTNAEASTMVRAKRAARVLAQVLASFGRSPLFLAGLLLRLCCLPVFGSTYLTDLFVPFLDSAVLHPGENPWRLSPPQFFPYGSVLYAILFVPRYLGHLVFGAGALGAGPLGLALVKAPLLILDISLLALLTRFAPHRTRLLMIFYWLNPVLFFITYVHGQLDVAGIAFLVLSLWLLVRRHPVASGLAMAAAVLSKFQVALVVPLMVAYLWNRHFAREALHQIAAWGGVLLGATAVGFLPVLLGGRLLYVTAGSPEAMRLFAAHLELGQGRELYLGAAAVVLLLGRLCVSTRISNMGLVLGAGVLLGSLLLVTDTAPGWYFWVLPFLGLFFASQDFSPRTLHWSLVVLYLLVFVPWPLGAVLPQMTTAVLFTGLQASLCACLIAVWIQVLKREMPLRGWGLPLLIGVAGDSGSGKNRLSGVFEDLFNRDQTLVIEGDDYHRWERGHGKWQEYTHLNPRANDLEDLATHTLELRTGRAVYRPRYDHSSGRFSAPRELRPAQTIVVQGLHVLYLRGMRDRFGLKVFLHPDEVVRLAWKIQRDVGERGHLLQRVLESFRERGADGREHILPQRDQADWIIEVKPRQPVTEAEVVAGKVPELMVDHVLWNDAPIQPLARALLEVPECRASWRPLEGQINRIAFRVEGVLSAERVREVASATFPSLRHVTRGRSEPVWREGFDGVNQLIAMALVEAAQEEG